MRTVHQGEVAGDEGGRWSARIARAADSTTQREVGRVKAESVRTYGSPCFIRTEGVLSGGRGVLRWPWKT